MRELEGEMERVDGFCCCSNGMSTSATKVNGMGEECRGPKGSILVPNQDAATTMFEMLLVRWPELGRDSLGQQDGR